MKRVRTNGGGRGGPRCRQDPPSRLRKRGESGTKALRAVLLETGPGSACIVFFTLEILCISCKRIHLLDRIGENALVLPSVRNRYITALS
jgi:hypothetical protein